MPQAAPQVAGSFYGAPVNATFAPAAATLVSSSRNLGAGDAIVLDASAVQILPAQAVAPVAPGSQGFDAGEMKVPEEDLPPPYVP
jgi:hypothetical protein